MDFISVNPVYTHFTPIPSLLVVAFCALRIILGMFMDTRFADS